MKNNLSDLRNYSRKSIAILGSFFILWSTTGPILAVTPRKQKANSSNKSASSAAVGLKTEQKSKTKIPVPAPKAIRTGPHQLKAIKASFKLSDNPTDLEILNSRAFEEPLIPMQGTGSIIEGENAALAEALKAFKAKNNLEDVSDLNQFINQYPSSRWTPSLKTTLGELRFHSGYLSQAQSLWTQAWDASKNEKGKEQSLVANRAIANLLLLDSRLGRQEDLRKYFKEIKTRPFFGSDEQKIDGARVGLCEMEQRPERAFKCGPFAVNNIWNIGKTVKDKHPVVDKAKSTKEGTSLSQVNKLADEVGLKYQVAKRVSQDAPIITPCVLHWKLGHYAAILKEENGKYHVKDPTFDTDGQLWISKAALNSESDGYFLIPKLETLPVGWMKVSDKEAATIKGKGVAIEWDGDPPGPDQCTTGDCCEKGGMAYASANKLLCTLMISDTPLGYSPPVGPSMDFGLNYKDLQTNQPSSFTFTNLGQNWNFNWLSYLTLNASNVATLRLMGGGSEKYTPNMGVYSPNFYSQALLVDVGGGVYERRMPDGSKQIYDLSDTSSPVRIFMTKVVDPQGNSVLIQYDSDFRIVSLTDATNQVSTISYVSNTLGNPGFYKIASITDPFSRSCSFSYDSTLTYLTSTTDVIGLVSKFSYNTSSSFITLMTTPYGSTSFYKYVPGANPNPARGLKFTFPDGTSSVIESWVGETESTFFWDRHAFSLYPNDPANFIYTHCVRTKFVMNLDNELLEPAIQYIAPPLESSPTFFTYPNQPSGNTRLAGSSNLPLSSSRSLGGDGNLIVNAKIGGTVTAGDVITISNNFNNVSYTVQAGDTLTTIANGLAANINANTTFRGMGITAGSVSNVVSMQTQSTGLPAGFGFFLNGGATETVDLNSMVRQTQVCTLSGPVVAGDIVSFIVVKPFFPNNGQLTFTYTAQAGDTLATLATNFASQVNADATCQKYQVSAQANGAVMNLTSFSPDPQLYSGGSPNGAEVFTFTSVLNGNTENTKYQYNAAGNMTQSIDPMGRTFSYIYDSNNIDLLEKREIRDGDNFLLGHWEYNSQHLPILYKDGSGQQTTYSYNSSGQPLSVTDANGNTTTMTYTGTATATVGGTVTTGDTLTITVHDTGLSGGQQAVNYTVQAGDTLTSIAAGLTSAINANSNLSAIGVTASSTAAVITLSSTSVNVTSYSQSTSGGATETIALTANRFGYLTKIDGPLTGNQDVTLISYDGFGRVFTQTDSVGYVLTQFYDDANRPTKTLYMDGTNEETKYDRLDAVLMKDRNGRWSQKSYDSMDRLAFEIDPLGRKTSYTWCDCGSLTSLTDPNGNTTSWQHDLEGRRTQKTYQNSTTVNYVYEARTSRLRSMTDALGQTKTYFYYPDGALYQVNYTNAQNPTLASSLFWDYNFQRMTGAQKNDWGGYSYSYNNYVTNASGPPTTGGGMLSLVHNTVIANSDISYQYDALGRTTNRSINGASNSIDWVYDAMSRVTSETNALGTFGYNYIDNTPGSSKGVTRLASINYPNNQVTNFTWFDNVGDQRLKEIHNLNPTGGTLSKFNYAYDPAGQITKWVQKQKGEAQNYQLGYDLAGQLISARSGLGNTAPPYVNQFHYSYDPGANRTAVQQSLGDAARITGTVTPGDKVRIIVHDQALTGGSKTIAYTVVAGDTLATIAVKLAEAITADFNLQAIGVNATALTATSSPSSVGAEIVLRSVSNNLTRFTSSKSAGATESIDTSIVLNGTQNARIGGTITAGDLLTITIKDNGLPGGQQVISYTVLGTDTRKTIATAFAAAINTNANLQAVGVTATSHNNVVNIQSLSLKATTYSKTLSAGATETIALSSNINGIQTAIIGGTITAGDVLTLTIYDTGLNTGSKAKSYTVLAGDTYITIAAGLAAAINSDTQLANEGIMATSSGAVVNIKSGSTELTTVSQSTSGGATETITLALAMNLTQYAHNNVNELTGISAGGAAYFQGTTNKAVKSMTVNSTPQTLDSTRDFTGNAVLSTGNNNVAVTGIDGGNNSKTNNYQISATGPGNSTLTYDANGNMTSDGTNSYVWDAENRLIQITYPGSGNNSQFAVDPLGRNVKIVEYSGGSLSDSKQFIWNGITRNELRDNSGTLVSRFFGIGQMNGSTKQFYSNDHVGSTRELTDNSGSVQAQYFYDLFGNSTKLQSTFDCDFLFGHYYFHQASGLSLTYARGYNSKLGRFLNRDPIQEEGGLNLYSYTVNPVGYIDPSGLAPLTSIQWENLTGYSSQHNNWGCLTLVGYNLGVPDPTGYPEGQKPINFPPGGVNSFPPGGTRCWWSGGGQNPTFPYEQTKCINCPKGTKKVFWCKQGQANPNVPSQPPGTPIEGNPLGPNGPLDPNSGLWNYSLWSPGLGFSDVPPRGGHAPPHGPSPSPPGTDPNYNRSYCCVTCAPQKGK